jgi:hypothetical protein
MSILVPAAVLAALPVAPVGKKIDGRKKAELATDLLKDGPLQMVILGIHVPAELVCLDVQLAWDVLHLQEHVPLVDLTHQRLDDGVHALILGALSPTPTGG